MKNGLNDLTKFYRQIISLQMAWFYLERQDPRGCVSCLSDMVTFGWWIFWIVNIFRNYFLKYRILSKRYIFSMYIHSRRWSAAEQIKYIYQMKKPTHIRAKWNWPPADRYQTTNWWGTTAGPFIMPIIQLQNVCIGDWSRVKIKVFGVALFTFSALVTVIWSWSRDCLSKSHCEYFRLNIAWSISDMI